MRCGHSGRKYANNSTGLKETKLLISTRIVYFSVQSRKAVKGCAKGKTIHDYVKTAIVNYLYKNAKDKTV